MRIETLQDFGLFRSFLSDLPYHALPGLTSQLSMAPAVRRTEIRNSGDGLNPTQSSVLLLFYPDVKGIPSMVLIRRAEYSGVHSGQIAFPGGRHEPEDDNMKQTALRETQEEIGVSPEDVIITGKLSELYIPPSNYMVHPYVGFVPFRPDFKPDQKEVSSLVEISLPLLFDTNNRHVRLISSGNYQVEAPCMMINGHIIWGATAMILAEFIDLTGEK